MPNDEQDYFVQAMHAWTIAMEPFFLRFGVVPPDDTRLRIALDHVPESIQTLRALTPPERYVRLHEDLWRSVVSARIAVELVRAGVADPAAFRDALEDLQIVNVEIARQLDGPDGPLDAD